MMETFVFKDLIIILLLSILVLLIGYRLKIPPVVGFLLTGVMSGPQGMGLVKQTDDVEMLAQIGIILLLFGIGMEFSVKKLMQVKRFLLLGGSLQIGLTVLVGGILAGLFGQSWGNSLFLGGLLAMSSTSIVLRILEQKGETAAPQGRVAISILIFQDMIAIPMLLLTPLLGQKEGKQLVDSDVFWLLMTGAGVLMIVFFLAQRIVPGLLLLVARTRNKELFLLTVFALCFGVAWLASSLGLSLTIGAFLAGLLISESEYSNEAISTIFPFQALFISFFFVSIGMLLNVHFVLEQPLLIALITLAVLLIKTLTTSLTILLLGMPIRTAILVGILLSQIGEFSFVLARTGIPFGLFSEYNYQLFLSVSFLTMAFTPALINRSTQIANFISSFPFPEKIRTGISPLLSDEEEEILEDHVIIVGFGISGKRLAHSSRLAGIPYNVLEMNPDTVLEHRQKGEPIHFGDATHLSVLEHLNIQEAKAIAVLINDPVAARRIVEVARQASPSIYIIVRARYMQEMGVIKNLGADEVITDEFGSSIEVFLRVLRQYRVPEDEIGKLIAGMRADGYEMLLQ